MFVKKYYEEPDQAFHVELIKRYPLGTIITTGPNGITANHFPFLVHTETAEDGSSQIILRAHFARANAQNIDLKTGQECLVIFQGPEDYVTPSWYKETKPSTGKVVPTWNFATVHLYGNPTVIEDPSWINQQMEDLTHAHEHLRSKPWKISDAPDNYVSLMQKAVYGLEIRTTRVQGKWKMSQNQTAKDVEGVVEGYKSQGQNDIAELVAEAKIRHDERKQVTAAAN
jgi:transcriptional regulator